MKLLSLVLIAAKVVSAQEIAEGAQVADVNDEYEQLAELNEEYDQYDEERGKYNKKPIPKPYKPTPKPYKPVTQKPYGGDSNNYGDKDKNKYNGDKDQDKYNGGNSNNYNGDKDKDKYNGGNSNSYNGDKDKNNGGNGGYKPTPEPYKPATQKPYKPETQQPYGGGDNGHDCGGVTIFNGMNGSYELNFKCKSSNKNSISKTCQGKKVIFDSRFIEIKSNAVETAKAETATLPAKSFASKSAVPITR